MISPRILLLTHEHELTKRTNTGRLVLEALGPAARQIVWGRTTPDAALLRAIETGGVALIWPLSASGGALPARAPEAFVVIDATWKQARRIYNRSPYLHALPKIALQPAEPSIYTLRRNQIDGGLCTAEAVACVLRQPSLAPHGGSELASAVMTRLQTLLGPRSLA